MKRVFIIIIIIIVIPLAGCAEILIGVGGLIASGIGIYQRVEDRNTQKDQTEEIKRLKEAVDRHQEEVRKLREGVKE